MEDADLDLLTSLLEESEGPLDRESVSGSDGRSDVNAQPDEFDDLFDADENGSYTEDEPFAGDPEVCPVQEDMATLFGESEEDDDDLVRTVPRENVKAPPTITQDKTKQDLEDELKRMQEQMKKLQEQLQSAALGQFPSIGAQKKSPGVSSKLAAKPKCSPLRERNSRKLMESDVFSAQLASPPLPKIKPREAPNSKLPPSENKNPPRREVSIGLNPPLNSKTHPSVGKGENHPSASASLQTKSPPPRPASSAPPQPPKSNIRPSVGASERSPACPLSIANKITSPTPASSALTPPIKTSNRYGASAGETYPGTSGSFSATNQHAPVEKFSGLRLRYKSKMLGEVYPIFYRVGKDVLFVDFLPYTSIGHPFIFVLF